MKLNLILKKKEKTIFSSKEVSYTEKEEIITFQIEDMTHIINLKNKEFTRENDEYAFFLDIEKENCEITLKKEQYYLQVPVEYATLLKNKNVIEINYFIETDDEDTLLIIELESEK